MSSDIQNYWGCVITLHCTREDLDKWYNKKYNELNSSHVRDFVIREWIDDFKYAKGYVLTMMFASAISTEEVAEFLDFPIGLVAIRTRYAVFSQDDILHMDEDIYFYEGVKSKTKSADKLKPSHS